MSSIMSCIIERLLILPGIIIGLSFHEFAHARVSYALGDPTPKLQGRVTMNPLAHIDWIGFAALMLFGFGWGKPVMIEPRYYKNRRLGEILTGAAGVTMNLLVAIVGTGILRLYYMAGEGILNSTLGSLVTQILVGLIQINIVLIFFNLIPLPPLDGFGILTQIFRLDRFSWYPQLYQLGPVLLLAIIFFNLSSRIITPPTQWLYHFLINLVF